MLKYINLFILNYILLNTVVYSQSDRLQSKFHNRNSEHYYFPDKGTKRGRWIGSAGITVGQEYFISLPKLSALREFPIRTNRSKYGFGDFSFYAGAEGSMFVLYAGVFGISANAGFAIGPLTIDNSITRTAIMGPSNERPGDYTTYNPKAGLNIGPVWLKTGPSFRLAGDGVGDWMNGKNGYWNFEILYIFSSE